MKKTDDKVLPSRAAELYENSAYSLTATDFFSPGDRVALHTALPALIGGGYERCFFWGGCLDAERTTAVFLPDWWMPEDAPPHRMPEDTERTETFARFLEQTPEAAECLPITALSIRGSGFCRLTHRDFMGSILALGVDRSVIGDIAVLGDAEALVFCADRIAPYLVENLTKISHDAVTVGKKPVPPTFRIPRRYEKTEIVLSSLRLDGVVKALTGKSREEAARLVRDGVVSLSWTEETDVSSPVKEGDVISVRGWGKAKIGGIEGTTRSGRIRIECFRYL